MQFVPTAPLHGLGFYDQTESSEHFSGYIWACWTKREAQPMQVDQKSLDMLASPNRGSASAGV